MVKVKPLAEINHEAIALLCRELGVVDTLRFIRQYTVGYGNYTEERRELYEHSTLAELTAEIKNKRRDG